LAPRLRRGTGEGPKGEQDRNGDVCQEGLTGLRKDRAGCSTTQRCRKLS